MKRNRQDIKFSAYLYKRLKELDDETFNGMERDVAGVPRG
jgi:hypothetical protein